LEVRANAAILAFQTEPVHSGIVEKACGQKFGIAICSVFIRICLIFLDCIRQIDKNGKDLSSIVPFIKADTSLSQYLVDKALMNIFTFMGIWYADFHRAPYHKLMFLAG
jgi:hypothetical protein